MTPGAGIEHDGHLPWGHWMRTVHTPSQGVVIVDEHGQHWSSLREAFWTGRLNMGKYSKRLIDENCELILAILASKAARPVPPGEIMIDLYRANSQACSFHIYWLQSAGLLQHGGPLEAGVTTEGASIARMLLVTRPSELAAIPIGAEALAAFGPHGSPTECDRAAYEAADGPSAVYPYAIVRETGFRRHEILMLHRDPEDVIPMARTIWSVTCPNPATRDRLFGWLHDRMTRWTAWGEMAKDHGAHALSQHLLALMMQDPGVARPTVEVPTGGLTVDRPLLR